ncbi:MAG: AAA family ATPase [Planctomycetota bacterium]
MVHSTISNGKLNGKPRSGRIPRPDLKPRVACEYDPSGLIDKYTAVGTSSPAASMPTITKKVKPVTDKSLEAKSVGKKLIDYQAKLLATILAEGKIPTEAMHLTQEMFDCPDNSDLWEECLKRCGDVIDIKEILQYSYAAVHTWDKEKLLALKKRYDPYANIPLMVRKIEERYVCDEAKRIANIIISKAGMGQVGAVNIQAGELSGVVAKVNKATHANLITISSAEFDAMDCSVKFLIEDVLVSDQPMVIGALSKSMKSSLMLDAAISLSTGTKFLDHYECVKTPAMIFSGESGKSVLQLTARSVCKARGFTLSEAGVRWSFQVPTISDREQVQIVRSELKRYDCGVLFIDPAYLAMTGEGMSEHAGNVFHFGRLLKGITEMCQELGVVLTLAHHFAKTTPVDPLDPCSLTRLSQAGFAEWAGQWILLERLVKYADDGKHELMMRTGGRAGHSGLHYLKIDEGHPKGSRWITQVMGYTQYKDSLAEAKQNADNVAERQNLLKQASYLQLILADEAKPISQLGLGNSGTANKVTEQLISMGWLKKFKKKSGNGKMLYHYKYVGGDPNLLTDEEE